MKPTRTTEVPCTEEKRRLISSFFGEETFTPAVMKEKLPRDIFENFMEIINQGKKLDLATANSIAHAMKEWALEKGATHYSHWFQPMTSLTAEKHDAFIEPLENGEVIERFSGKQLAQGEPDASSFPSGGIRSTFEARGYTVWDPTSPAFIMRRGKGITLCIPSVFLSYTGEALDNKTPLLRSISAIDKSALRMLKLLGNRKAKRVVATLGPEQEYFLINREYYNKRQDLVLTGRTLIGSPPSKGQQLEDHYFGTIKERILTFMHEVEEELFALGIPAKTRHNEVAPSQFELAPIFEEANIAVDHNQLLMQTLKKIAARNGLVALLHEKPFAGINGSGKHVNWSLSDDTGNNLLNPGNTPHDNIQFLMFLVATIRAVYLYGDLLRVSVASSANDHRLGANEAPPAIISVFIGEQLTKILESIESGAITDASNAAIIELGISQLPLISKDNTDRNRTSPFAFTGNKFEFRAVGSRQSISLPTTVLNTIVAESLDYLADKLEKKDGTNIKQNVIDIIQEEMKAIKPILFNGDNYSKKWETEAGKRGLPNKKNLPASMPDLVSQKNINLFQKYNVLSEVEVRSRYHIRIERYCKKLDIEAMTLYKLVKGHVIPASVLYQKELAQSIQNVQAALGGDCDLEAQKGLLKKISQWITSLIKSIEKVNEMREQALTIEDEQKQAEYFCNEIKPEMEKSREICDKLEELVCDELWSLPKFWEMLFLS
ncbi:MAG TPA: glutamine synthetase III [Spirochaetota bacterium]|nr:glutamine synthetase III [Spirochaetota bacterium]HQP49223.1 glutamine synthetase III [Spirochaetota bacterium]